MMTRGKIAVIGAGYWGRNLVRIFSQLGALKTICDRTAHICEQMNASYPGIMVTEDIDKVLADEDIIGVVIAVPAVLHFELSTKVLLANKHVFVEKPLSLNYSDGEALVQLAAERQKTLFVGHVLHYHPAVIKLKEMINSGAIGRMEYIYSRRLSLGKIRREENILWSFAPHDISIILSLTTEKPSYIDCIGNNFLNASIPDVTVTNLKFPSGTGAHIFVSWLNPFKEQRLVVVGNQGMLVFDDTQPVDQKLVLYPHTIHWKNGLPIAEKAEGVAITLSDHWEEPLKSECRAFLEAVVGSKKPFTSGEEGLRVLAVLEASQKSLREKEGRTQTQPPPTTQPAKLSLPTEIFIDKTAIVDDDVRIGKGTKIWHFSHVLSGSTIGNQCNIGQNVVIGPDVDIGDRCKFQNNVSVYKGVTLEDGVFCGPSMVFTNIYNPRAEISKMDQVCPTLVKKGATLGANCTIVCGHTIGNYAFIGAGAVVTCNVPDHALMVGNPAKQKGWVCECAERLTSKLKCPVCKKVFQKDENGILLKLGVEC
jgi:UDP-2-acetamido-3-amino-2,3-dideoxy-glucuronate N-acetyltransferase